MKLEEFKNYVDKNIMSIMSKSNEEERDLLNVMIKTINRLCEKEQELITYLKEEIKEYEEKCNNTCVFLEQDRCETRINTYKEILSKIEKR